MRNLKFEHDKKSHEYRCYKDGEIFTYIYERYEPTNPKRRRIYYRVKDAIFYKFRDAKDYVKLLSDLQDNSQQT